MQTDVKARKEEGRTAEVLARIRRLTVRHRDVLALVVTGMLNKQVAAELGISEKTVKVHRARVMEKMRAESVAELVRLADFVARAPSQETRSVRRGTNHAPPESQQSA